MQFVHEFDSIFPREYLRAALLVSLLSVWVLVGLFYYLNRYTKRYYFTVWTTAWLFYALWLTLGINIANPDSGSVVPVLRLWCICLSAAFLLWGSVSFLEMKAPQDLFGWFIAFLLIWSYAARFVVDDPFNVQWPVFVLIGLASMFAGFSFYRLRKQRRFVAVSLLVFGFCLWGVYLISYPISQKYSSLVTAGFLFSAVLQLFIGVSMIVLVLEEARLINQQILQEVDSVNSEKRELQLKVLSAEDKCRSLFEQARSRTELQAAYDELRQTQESVVQQERLRALGQMASGIAHDVNNALSPVLAFSELLLKKEPNLSASGKKHLANIRVSAEDIAQIVARLGEFYRRHDNSEARHSVSPTKLMEQVKELTSPCWHDIPESHGVAIQVQSRFDQFLPSLYCNEFEIREALTNMILNSVDAMPRGGLITLGACSVSLPDTLGQNGKATHVILEVSDNGIGMDENTRQHCLEPFFSTKRLRGGSGLGLAMVYGTAQRHRGRIEIESEVDKGTTVRLILPLSPPPQSKIAVVGGASQPDRSLRVLFIDDEPLLREMIQEVLSFHQHQVESAEGGEAGVAMFEKAKAKGQPFDVVITDLGMPGMDGKQVAERIKASSPKTPVILLTGWGMMLEEKGEGMSNVDALMNKPPRANDLLQVLAKVVSPAASPRPLITADDSGSNGCLVTAA
jgi:signal transduction histidine kinase/ActR/RegA family two-component response regulator